MEKFKHHLFHVSHGICNANRKTWNRSVHVISDIYLMSIQCQIKLEVKISPMTAHTFHNYIKQIPVCRKKNTKNLIIPHDILACNVKSKCKNWQNNVFLYTIVHLPSTREEKSLNLSQRLLCCTHDFHLHHF